MRDKWRTARRLVLVSLLLFSHWSCLVGGFFYGHMLATDRLLHPRGRDGWYEDAAGWLGLTWWRDADKKFRD